MTESEYKKMSSDHNAFSSHLKDARTCTGMLRSENGAVLVVVIILSAVVLAVMTALSYMIITSTRISGMHKQYKTALEAGRGGMDIFYDVINLRGDPGNTAAYLASLNVYGLTAVISPNGTCISGGETGLRAKLLTSTNTPWVGCDSSLNIVPATQSTYDLTLTMGSGAVGYNVYAKITRTVSGDSGSGSSHLTDPTVGAGGIISAGDPYLYSIEILALNSANPQERARLSILYKH